MCLWDDVLPAETFVTGCTMDFPALSTFMCVFNFTNEILGRESGSERNDGAVLHGGTVALGMRRVPGTLAEDPFLLTLRSGQRWGAGHTGELEYEDSRDGEGRVSC